jgi:hypothetical protein
MKRTSARHSQLSSPGFDRATQYSGLFEIHSNGGACWFPAFAGMTVVSDAIRINTAAPASPAVPSPPRSTI